MLESVKGSENQYYNSIPFPAEMNGLAFPSRNLEPSTFTKPHGLSTKRQCCLSAVPLGMIPSELPRRATFHCFITAAVLPIWSVLKLYAANGSLLNALYYRLNECGKWAACEATRNDPKVSRG